MDVVVTEAATFRVREGGFVLVELADGVPLDWVHDHAGAASGLRRMSASMREAVICEPLRTAVGGFGVLCAMYRLRSWPRR